MFFVFCVEPQSMRKFFFLFLLSGTPVTAQHTLDSLQVALSKASNDSLKAETHYQIAREQFSARNYEASVKSAQQSADLFKKLKYPLRQSSAIQQIARAYRRQNNHKAAADNFKQALELSTQVKDTTTIILALNGLSNSYNDLGDFDSSRKYSHQSIEICEPGKKYYELGGAYTSMAISYVKQGKYDKGLEWHLRALRVREEYNFKPELSSSYLNIGLVLDTWGKPKEAIEYYQKSYSIKKELGDSAGMARVLNNIGIVYKNENRLEEALKTYLESASIGERLGGDGELVLTYINLANLYKRNKNYQSALLYYRKSLAMAEQYQDHYTIGEVNVNLGEFYQDIKEYKNSEKHYLIALQYADSTQSLEQYHYAYDAISELYALTGRYDKAYHTLRQYLIYNDSIFKIENAEAIEEMKAKYDAEKNERDLAEARASLAENELSIQKNRNVIILVSAGSIILLIGGTFFYRQEKLKRLKDKKEAEFNLQLAEAERVNELQQERLRISRELHDNIGSQLTFINSSIDSVGQSQKVEEVKKLTLDTIRELRKTVWLVNQADVTIDEFAVKLREYLNQGTVLPISVSISGNEVDKKLSSTVATHIFRVIQEAVNNSIKHAQASQITVELNAQTEKLIVSIQDNGIGFSQDNIKSGYGLKNMNGRIASINGTFNLTSNPGETKITFQIPVT